MSSVSCDRRSASGRLSSQHCRNRSLRRAASASASLSEIGAPLLSSLPAPGAGPSDDAVAEKARASLASTDARSWSSDRSCRRSMSPKRDDTPESMSKICCRSPRPVAPLELNSASSAAGAAGTDDGRSTTVVSSALLPGLGHESEPIVLERSPTPASAPRAAPTSPKTFVSTFPDREPSPDSVSGETSASRELGTSEDVPRNERTGFAGVLPVSART